VSSLFPSTTLFRSLRDVGDRCLLVAGLFPDLAQRRRVSVDYFVDLGRGAYQAVADAGRDAYAELFAHLAAGYRELVSVLRRIRGAAGAAGLLRPAPAVLHWPAAPAQVRARKAPADVRPPAPAQVSAPGASAAPGGTRARAGSTRPRSRTRGRTRCWHAPAASSPGAARTPAAGRRWHGRPGARCWPDRRSARRHP